MKKRWLFYCLVFWLGCFQLCTQNISQDTLPDDYLMFSLQIQDGRLEGANEYLEGFKVTMDVPSELLTNGFKGFDIKTLIEVVKNNEITGTLAYPDGKTTKIEYEVVRHRKTEDIYMKSTLGYFLWEKVAIQDDKLVFVIYWWYCPPARKVDLETLELTEQLLLHSKNWHKNDDRK